MFGFGTARERSGSAPFGFGNRKFGVREPQWSGLEPLHSGSGTPMSAVTTERLRLGLKVSGPEPLTSTPPDWLAG